MDDINIEKLYEKLESIYPDSGYMSRAYVFNRALREGKISKEVRDKAQDYYGRLWNYVGD